jgi:hypothetical protein
MKEDSMGFFQELANAFGFDNHDHTQHDVRGWSVNDDAGTPLGTMEDWLYDRDSSEIRYGIVNVDSRRVLIPVGDLRFDDDRRTVNARGYDRTRLAALRAYEASGWNDDIERAHYRDHITDATTEDRLDYTNDRFRGDLSPRIRSMEDQLRIDQRPVETAPREAEFAAAEPSEFELRRRQRPDERVDVLPIDDASDLNRPI